MAILAKIMISRTRFIECEGTFDNMVEKPNRRKLLKTVAGGMTATTVVSSGSAMASPEDKSAKPTTDGEKLKRKYEDSNEVRNAIQSDADTLIDTLEKDGYIGSSSASELMDEAKEISIDVVTEDKTTGFITIVEEFQGYETSIYVLPEEDRSYAFVHENGEIKALVDPDMDSGYQVASTTESEAGAVVTDQAVHASSTISKSCDFSVYRCHDNAPAPCTIDYYPLKTYRCYESLGHCYVTETVCPIGPRCCKKNGLGCKHFYSC